MKSSVTKTFRKQLRQLPTFSTVNPSHDQFEFMARLFRAVEAEFGETSPETAYRFISGGSKLATKKVLQPLRDEATLPRKQLNSDRRRTAIAIMRSNTPVNRLISRHTRELLRHCWYGLLLQFPPDEHLYTLKH